MARLKFNHRRQVTFGVLTVFIGICIILSSYFGQKRFEVFNLMNMRYYDQMIDWDIGLLDPDNIDYYHFYGQRDSEISNGEENYITYFPEASNSGNNHAVVGNSEATSRPGGAPTTTRPPADDSRHFIGYLNIPRINLRRGFVEPTSRLNNVNRNIQVIQPSDMPNVRNGNMIIAAHSGTSSVSFFRDLWQVEIGDEVIINYQGREFRYIIRNIYFVPYTGRVPIRRDRGQTTLTLITCTRGQRDMQTVYIAELVS